MASVIVEQEFELTREQLWLYIGDFGDTGKWSGRPKEACVQEGDGIGSLRTLTIADGRIIVDRLEAESEFSYTYSVVSGELPYRNYRATMSAHALAGNKSLFRWEGHFEPLGMSEEECIEFTKKVYAMGIRMMQENIQE